MKTQRQKGISLIEILVVIAIFAVLGIIITRSVALTLGGSRKSESLVNVRENLDHALSIIERQIRNADSISQCPNPDPAIINFSDENGNIASFSCIRTGLDDSYIASGSARLTSTNVKIANCSFICSPETGSSPPSVTISLEAEDANTTGIQGSTVTAVTQINLRTY